MDAFHLDIKKRFRIDDDAGPLLDKPGQIDLIAVLDLPPLFLKFRIIGKGLDFFDFIFKMADPAVADSACETAGKGSGCSARSSAAG